MHKGKKGFTLIEMMVVVLIIGILATIGLPYYYKTIEVSKATDALAIGHLLGNSVRMFEAENPDLFDGVGNEFAGGPITNGCNSSTCVTTDYTACRIIGCNYAARQDWSTNSSYQYYVCNPAGGGGGGCCAVGIVSCVRRNGGSNPYNGWGYHFDNSGVCGTAGGAGTPGCITF